jgi:phage/plasmid-like protein (TIGR03299 family)
MTWLNTNTLIGFTEKRGNAWHYRAADQGDEPNHYPGAIPVDDVLRRLFNFTAQERLAAALVPCSVDDPAMSYIGKDGLAYRVVEVERDRYWLASDDDSRLGHHSSGYAGHQYQEWLIDNVASILGDELGIGSAGLLSHRAKAWVQVELPDSIETPEGFTFRPFFLAGTSFNGSMASRFKLCMQAVVCDNTLDLGMSEATPTVRVKHSRHSSLRIAETRDALRLLYTAGDSISAAIRALCEWDVTPAEFGRVVEAVVPIPVGPKATPHAVTIAARKRDAVTRIAMTDPRASTWFGTALGVVQAFNTYLHHESTVRGVDHRAERNMANALDGSTAKADGEVLDVLARVTGRTDRLMAVAAALEGDKVAVPA